MTETQTGGSQLYQAAINRMIDQAQKGFVPDYNNLPPEQLNIKMPLAPQDRPFDPKNPYGPPEDWDYKTAEFGWNGEKLPEGAVGWTPFNEPYWGTNSALGEWYKGVGYRVLDRDVQTFSLKESQDAAAQSVNKLLESFKNYDETKMAGVVGAVTEGIGTTFDIIGQLFTKRPEDDQYRDPNAWAIASRGIGEVLKGVGNALGEAAIFTERAIFTIDEGLEEIGADSSIPEWRSPAELLNQKAQDWEKEGFWADAAKFVAGINEKIDILDWTWNTLRSVEAMAGGKFHTKELGEVVDKNWQAGRIMYSNTINPALKTEFIRRYQAGENPYLLSLELGNPIAEGIGQTILDPLNFVGMAAKGAKATRTYKNTVQYVGKAVSEVADDLADIGKATDAGSLKKIVLGTHAAVQRTKQTFLEFDKGKGIAKLLTSGKRSHIERLVGDYLGEIVRRVGTNPDDVLEVVDAIVKLDSGDAGIIHDALVTLGKRMPLNHVLSEGGLRSAVAIKSMLTNADGVVDAAGFLEDLENSKDAATLLEKMMPRLNKATEALFPTLADQQAQYEKLRKAGKMEEAAKIALSGSDQFIRHVEKIADSKILRGANNFFAHLYMGMSPGYAFRNGITNNVHILIDQGIGAYIDGKGWISNKRVHEQLDKMLLGVMPMGLKKALGGPATSGLGVNVGDRKFYNYFLHASRQMEVNAGARIMLKSIKDTFGKMGPYVLDFTGLKKAGVSGDDVSFIQNIIKNSYYDFDTAMPIIRDALKTGYIDELEAMAWMGDGTRKALDEYGMLEEIIDIAKNKDIASQEDLLNAIDDVFKERLTYAGNTSYDIGKYADASETAEDLHHLPDVQAYDASQTASPELTAAFERSKTANKIADDEVRKCSMQYLQMAKSQMGDKAVSDIIYSNSEWVKIYEGTFFDDVSKEARQLRDSVWLYSRGIDNGTITPMQVSKALGMEGIPENITPQAFKNYMWNSWWNPKNRGMWAKVRDAHATHSASLMKTLVRSETNPLGFVPHANDIEVYDRMMSLLGNARDWDTGIVQRMNGGLGGLHLPPAVYKEFDDITRLAIANGIPTITPRGAKLDNTLLKIVEKYTGKKYKSIFDLPYDDFAEALRLRHGDDFVEIERLVEQVAEAGEEAAAVEKATDAIRPIGVTNPAGGTPSNFEPFKQAERGLTKLRETVKEGAAGAFGKKRAFMGSEELEEALNAFEQMGRNESSNMRAIAVEIANAARDFALVDYSDKRGFDLILGLIYPYQFWYSRTYANWLQRIAMQPHIIAAYQRYKDTLAKIHAGAPEWWKYNINTNELLGLDWDNPLLFNLEATLNPLNGIAGTDFNDPYKRVDAWTKFLDGIGKFGPSVHPLLSIGTAYSLYLRGEEEAAARWGGRLIPQTKPMMAIDALIGDDPVEDYDFFVQAWSGGVDSYTRRKAGRALGEMQMEDIFSEEQALDVSRMQEGTYWEEAVRRANAGPDGKAALGQLFSFFLGTGFKARSIGDLMTDQFYTEYYGLMEMRTNLTSDEFRERMDTLHNKFPMMDTILVSRKAGKDRDTAYAYTVLKRIPPGQSRDILDLVGLNNEIVSQFYETKGDFDEWKENDYKTFMAAIVNLSSVLAVPENSTQDEWTSAKNQYGRLNDFIEAAYGKDIHEKIDYLYSLYGDTPDNREDEKLFKSQYPEVEKAMTYKEMAIASNPESDLATYYGGIDQIYSYYKSLMYAEAKEEFGTDIFEIQNGYYAIPENQSGLRKKYKREHPQLEAYWKFLRDERPKIDQKVVALGAILDKPLGAKVREDVEEGGIGAGTLAEKVVWVDPVTQLTPEDWQVEIGQYAYDYIYQYLFGGQALPYDAEGLIEDEAAELGLHKNDLIQLVGISIAQQNQVMGLQ